MKYVLFSLFLLLFLFTCNEDSASPEKEQPNTVPIASFTFSPLAGYTTSVFQFDASGSSDNEDSFSQLRFSWDWENDGIWEVNNSTNYNPSHQFNSVGTFSVRLRVTDSGNLFDAVINTVTILVEGTEFITDIDGNVYKIVEIGNRWWMAENLKVTHYRNGDIIPYVTSDSLWYDTQTGAHCIYGNDSTNISIYGRLYNWYALNDIRGLAPQGWHVPSDEEWKQFEIYLGIGQLVVDSTGYRGTDEGGKLKEIGTIHWKSPNTGATNVTGFTALPSAFRGPSGVFWSSLDEWGYWWTSTEDTSGKTWYRNLVYNNSQIGRSLSPDKRTGFSIRCVKDY